jgi:hypothetical protein
MKYFFLFFALFFSSFVYSITPEEEFAKNREIISKALNDPNYSKNIRSVSNGNEIVHRYSKFFPDVDGSKRTVNVTVSKPVDPNKVGKTIAERLSKAKALGKASLPSFLGSAALTALLNGIGWVMDEGGKIQYLANNTDIRTTPCTSLEPCYGTWIYRADVDNKPFSSHTAACIHEVQSRGQTFVAISYRNNYSGLTCESRKSNGQDDWWAVSRYLNPSPNPSAENVYIEVNTDQLATKIAQIISNPPDQTAEQNNKSLVGSAYSSDPTFNLSDDTVNGLANKIGEQVASGLRNASINPNATHSSVDSSDNASIAVGVTADDTSGSIVSTPTEVVDPVTGETTTTDSGAFTLKFPKFCSWATPVCFFFDWVYEKYEVLTEVKEEDTELDFEEEDEKFTEKDVETEIEFRGFCPQKKVIEDFRPPFHTLKLELEYDIWCDIAEDIKPIVVAFSFWLYVLIVTGFSHRSDD